MRRNFLRCAEVRDQALWSSRLRLLESLPLFLLDFNSYPVLQSLVRLQFPEGSVSSSLRCLLAPSTVLAQWTAAQGINPLPSRKPVRRSGVQGIPELLLQAVGRFVSRNNESAQDA